MVHHEFFGTCLKHLVDGRCVWFLDHLVKNKLLGTWCPRETIVEDLRTPKKKGGIHFLQSMISSKEKRIGRCITDVRMSYTREFTLLQCDILGYWQNTNPALRSNLYLDIESEFT